MSTRFIIFIILIQALSFTSFSQKDKARTLLLNCIDAHGGIRNWNKQNGLSFTKKDKWGEREQNVPLKGSKSYFPSEFIIAEDKNNNSIAQKGIKNPTFYFWDKISDQDLYFFTMPFMLLDSNLEITYGGRLKTKGEFFEVLEVSFLQTKEFEASKAYKVLINPETYQIEWVFGLIPFQKFNDSHLTAKHYLGWSYRNGIIAPNHIVDYRLENNEVTKGLGSTTSFLGIKYAKKFKN